MAFTYSEYEDYYGTAHGKTPALIREYEGLQTSSTASATGFNVAQFSATILGPASEQPGGNENSFYYIWSILGNSDDTGASLGFVYQSSGTTGGDHPAAHQHLTADAATIAALGFSSRGPYFWTTDCPIRLGNAMGLKYDAAATAGGVEVLTVMYSVVHPDKKP